MEARLFDAAGGGRMSSEVRGSLGAPRDLELGQDARDVVLDGLLHQVELFPDLLVRPAIGDQREDALLLRRQTRELLVTHQVLALAESIEDRLGDGRIQEALSGP